VTFSRIDQSIAYGALFTALPPAGQGHRRADRIRLHRAVDEPPQHRRADFRDDAQPGHPAQGGAVPQCHTIPLPHSTDREAVLKMAQDLLLAKGVVQRGDMIVITWGEPMGQVGGTNALNIMKVGEY
jgi:pyruvate kinase